jgi:acetylornithine deacetylase
MIQSARVMTDPCVALLEQLVSIDSVNPSLVEDAAGEAAIAESLATHMRALGLDVHVQPVAPGRPNVIGVLETGVPGPSLMFCGHVDTVGVAGMSSPFTPVIRDGRLYGRGSQDMKGGIAAMVDAARVLRKRAPARGRLIVAAVVDEEFASLGADALVRDWRADAAVVTEPTDLQIGVGHKGFAWFDVETRGRAAHGSRPRDGRDAILRMGRVLNRLEALDRELQSRPAHPVLGTASLHASLIQGGREWSVYPDSCRLSVERRTVVGESVESGAEELRRLLEVLHGEDPEFEAESRTVFARPAYETPRGHAIITALQQCTSDARLAAGTVGMSFWTDAAILGGAGVPSVLFGPGGAGLHSTEEYVRLDEVLVCRDVLASLAERWLAR